MPARCTIAKLIIGGLAFSTVPLFGQWQSVRTNRVPKGRDGKPNLLAPAPKMPDGKTPDFSGIWNPIRIPCTPTGIGAVFGCSDVPLGVPIGLFDVTSTGSQDGQEGTTSKLPYQPGVEASVQKHLREDRKDDPTTRCLPISPVRQWADFFPQKIIQTNDAVTVLSEYMVQFRQIFLDGRPLPKEPFPSFKGYSVGHWDGDALVVETTGYKDGLWLDLKGDPLTSSGRTMERIRRPSYGSLEVELTVDDPKVYTRPWSAKRYLHIMLDTELIEDICNENEKSFTHIFGK
jgi:hypothetical protein